MVKFLSFWNRDDGKKEHQRNLVYNEQQADAQRGADPNEYIQEAKRASFFIKDPLVEEFLDEHPAYRALVPAFSPVNRTTSHISKQDAKVAWLDHQILFTMLEMTMRPEDYEAGALEILQGFEIFGATQISDGFEGFKAKALTQQTKIIKTAEAK